MAKKKITESIKVDSEVVELVKKSKETTGVPIGVFFELAAKKELKLIKSQSK